MTEEGDFLRRLVRILEDTGISYMVVGSLASGLYGQPRSTQDFDIVITPEKKQLNEFIKLFREGYYISSEAAEDAFVMKSMFNVIDEKTGWKADFIIGKDNLFTKTQFSRRIRGDIFGVPTIVTSPEDVIISKLIWSKASDFERQLRDALGVVLVQWETLNRDYLRKWAKDQKVEDLLDKVYSEAGKVIGE